jgi:hypothetical protein
MKRLLMSCSVALALVSLSAGAAQAEVKTKDKSQVKFEGMLGRMVGMFGGKAAREGVIATSAVKGDRKMTITDTTGRIVDLGEEKVYDLDLKKKTYTVVTFAQLRQQMKEAQEKAAKEAAEQQKEQAGKEKEQPSEKSPEVEVDFDLKETGQKKQILTYDAREVVMTITVRQKGKTLEDGGGMVLTSDMWLGPEIPAMKELVDFEVRYWKAIAPEASGMSAEQMATVMAMYPMLKQGMERLNKEKVNMRGTALATVTTFDAVKGKEQMAKESESSSSNNSGGGLSGMLARKMMKKQQPSEDKARATILTATTETLEISTTVAAADLEIPAGFRQEK